MDTSAIQVANKAIFDGDLDLLKAVVAAGLDVHQALAHGNTLLRNATLHDDSGPLRLLLELGADANHRSNYRSPVNKRFEAGFTPLLYAHTVDTVTLLVAHGADVNAASDAGTTPLMRAATEAVARVLVENGAKLDAVNQAGTTALMFAANAGNADVVCYLLSRGADPSLRQIYRRGKKTYTALRLAEEGLATWSKFAPHELGDGGAVRVDNFRRIVEVLRAAGSTWEKCSSGPS